MLDLSEKLNTIIEYIDGNKIISKISPFERDWNKFKKLLKLTDGDLDLIAAEYGYQSYDDLKFKYKPKDLLLNNDEKLTGILQRLYPKKSFENLKF